MKPVRRVKKGKMSIVIHMGDSGGSAHGSGKGGKVTMVSSLKDNLIQQINSALEFVSSSLTDENGNYIASEELYDTFITMALAAIRRSTGNDSTYAEQANRAAGLRSEGRHTDWQRITGTLVGVLEVIREAINSGYLDRATDIIHGAVFADFLEMAQHLLDQGYKDAAAVIAGSSLEAHLRHLCDTNGVDATTEDGKPKKADRMNADLAKANAYQVLDQKNITAWLDLRNKAAHGEYETYTSVMVADLISGIRHFMSRSQGT